MNTDPYIPTAPEVDHPRQSMLAALLAALVVKQPKLVALPGGNHIRAGVTKNKMQPRDRARVKMAKASRRRNRRR